MGEPKKRRKKLDPANTPPVEPPDEPKASPKRPVGRPPVEPEERLSTVLTVRCRQEAFEAMYDAAAADEMKLRPWVRAVLEREAMRRLQERADAEASAQSDGGEKGEDSRR